MRAPCNLSETEAAEALELFDHHLTDYEVAEARQHFTFRLFYETWGRKDFREYWCENCGHFEGTRDKTHDPYINDLFSNHHGDYVTCPVCGEEVELIALGRMRTFKSLRQEIKVCFLRAGRAACNSRLHEQGV